jgi:hypothetical protein
VSRTCRDSVETYSVEMGESPFMRDGWAVLQPTLTAHSRLVAHSGPVRLFCFFFPPSAPLIFGTGFGDDVSCDYFSVVTCGFRVASVWLPSNLVDGDTIS